MDLEHSRKDRFMFYLRSVLSPLDASNVYDGLNDLPACVLEVLDKAIYEHLQYYEFIAE